jgi:hypothetical protein
VPKKKQKFISFGVICLWYFKIITSKRIGIIYI